MCVCFIIYYSHTQCLTDVTKHINYNSAFLQASLLERNNMEGSCYNSTFPRLPETRLQNLEQECCVNIGQVYSVHTINNL
jgi:hypothetical protein